jgi:putative effector of murein hydrolase
MSRSALFAPLMIAAACVPCLLVLMGWAFLVTGATSAVLALFVSPWTLVIAAPLLIGSALVVFKWRRLRSCELPETSTSSPG